MRRTAVGVAFVRNKILRPTTFESFSIATDIPPPFTVSFLANQAKERVIAADRLSTHIKKEETSFILFLIPSFILFVLFVLFAVLCRSRALAAVLPALLPLFFLRSFCDMLRLNKKAGLSIQG
ncbi:MAG: hypothetical protein MR437_01205 [Clostridiales bacterium]|nr:hypothetical protein [Clostridiales bacterium]